MESIGIHIESIVNAILSMRNAFESIKYLKQSIQIHVEIYTGNPLNAIGFIWSAWTLI